MQALRLSKQETELDARVGILALQLGMYSDAARLFKECKRYDLLSELMQAQGSWDDAIELVEKHERIALRTVHFNHAKYLESTGEIEEAIEAYELAKAHSHEVPDEPLCGLCCVDCAVWTVLCGLCCVVVVD